nr:SDR family oxidoreductase [Holzapfeliella floricola]
MKERGIEMSKQTKVVIITGASSGIGKSTAELLLKENFKVVLAARRLDKLEEIVQKLSVSAEDYLAVETDVTDVTLVDNLVEQTMTKFGRVDVLINSAGIMPLSTLAEGRVNEWDNMIDVNIRGTLHSIKNVLPIMRKQRNGHIINIASIAAHEANPLGGVYGATKAAVLMISNSLRKEESNAKSNVRVSVISPGAGNT